MSTKPREQPEWSSCRVFDEMNGIVNHHFVTYNSSDSAVSGIFGTGGNAIQFTSPDISYDFDFDTAPTRK